MGRRLSAAPTRYTREEPAPGRVRATRPAPEVWAEARRLLRPGQDLEVVDEHTVRAVNRRR